jgi:hypothetical protein
VTRDLFGEPSFVIWTDAITLGGDAGDWTNRAVARIATTLTMIKIPQTRAFLFGRNEARAHAAAAVEKAERIRSFESDAGLAADAVAKACPDSVSRRRFCRSVRMSAELE